MREWLLGIGVLGAAVNAGVFFAFSVMVMPAVDRLAEPRESVTAMQAMNTVTVQSSYMIVLFGTAAVMVWLGVLGVGRLPSASGWLTVAGAVVFVLGAVVWTIAFHVPLNDTLAAVGPGDDPARAWAAFSPSWTAGNHVRVAASIVAAGLLAAASRLA